MSNMMTVAAHSTLEKLSDIADEARHRVDDLPLHLPHRRRKASQPRVTIALATIGALVGLLVWNMRRTQSVQSASDPAPTPPHRDLTSDSLPSQQATG